MFKVVLEVCFGALRAVAVDIPVSKVWSRLSFFRRSHRSAFNSASCHDHWSSSIGGLSFVTLADTVACLYCGK